MSENTSKDDIVLQQEGPNDQDKKNPPWEDEFRQ